MVALKEMPYGEKYRLVSDFSHAVEEFTLPFIREQAGKANAAALLATWESGLKPIPETGSDEQKYEVAYQNFIIRGTTIYELLRRELGQEGVDRFAELETRYMLKENDSVVVKFLSLVRMLSPRTAFNMVADQLIYQMQWITPYTISEQGEGRIVMDIPRCKVLDYPGTQDICAIGCQRVTAAWVAELFKVRLEFEVEGHACTSTATRM